MPEAVGYAEPYAGGAGAAIRLLAEGDVGHIFLNDYDWRIYCAWNAILNDAEKFVDAIRSVDLDIPTWKRQREIVYEASQLRDDPFVVGFATFFLNRTNRSGIVVGAGPIGGYEQTGRWKIDARFSRDALAARVKWLASKKEKITLSNEDGLSFLRRLSAEKGQDTFFFIDPPYVNAGSRLYMNAMSEALHMNLASFLISNKNMPNWLVTYDDCPLIRSCYRSVSVDVLDVKYSLQAKRKASELIISPI